MPAGLQIFHFYKLPVGNFPMPMGKAFQESHLSDYNLVLQTPQDLLHRSAGIPNH
jgi:hypothetical protein